MSGSDKTHADRIVVGLVILFAGGVVVWISTETWEWVNSGSVVADLTEFVMWIGIVVSLLLVLLFVAWLTTAIFVEAPLKALELREKWGGGDGE